MQRNDAGAEIEIINSFETGIFYKFLQLFLVRVHTDRFGEVTITIAVIRNESRRSVVAATHFVRNASMQVPFGGDGQALRLQFFSYAMSQPQREAPL